MLLAVGIPLAVSHRHLVARGVRTTAYILGPVSAGTVRTTPAERETTSNTLPVYRTRYRFRTADRGWIERTTWTFSFTPPVAGSTTTMHYDGAHPEVAILPREWRLAKQVLLIGGPILIVLGIVFLAAG